MKTFLIGIFAIFIVSVNAQTCVGIVTVNVMHPKTHKLIGDKLEKSITYVYTGSEEDYYAAVNEAISLKEIKENEDDYKIYKNEKQYKLFPDGKDGKVIFPSHCGVYLVHLELIYKNDSMSMSIYNIPAHQSFEIDSVIFEKGEFILNLETDNLLAEFVFEEMGYFRVSPSYIEKMTKPDDGEE